MLTSRRFLPYFITQCLGALNDNIYKNVLLLLVTYSQVNTLPMSVDMFVNLAAGVFILPFFLFSAHAGIVADNMDKALLIRRLKSLELIIMSCAAVAILSQHYMMMLLLLFLTGSQSAYFGPVKYSLLPQALHDKELVRGNAWVEMGTFLSILIGTLSAGLLVASDDSLVWSALTVAVLALAGFAASRAIPALPAQGTIDKIRFEPLSGAWRTISKARQKPAIWIAILAISWFWFLGATYLTQFPHFALQHLHSGATVVSLLLALFSVGIAAGSFVCARLSFGQVELGLLPFGVFGLTVFGVDLLLAVPEPASVTQPLYQFSSFIADSRHYRLMFDLFMVGLSGGVFIVPLYAFIQSRAEKGQCAQAIAANNIINALFMVTSAILSMVLLGVMEWTILQLFLLIAVMNILVAIYVYTKVPEFTQRFVSYLVCHVLYRVTVTGREHVPKEGAGMIVCNHVSYWDALLIMGASPRPIRFVMDKSISDAPIVKLLFRHAEVIPICSVKQDEATYLAAFESIKCALDNAELVCLFPYAQLTLYGELAEFKASIDKMLALWSVGVTPVALQDLWGAYFSHQGGRARMTTPRRFGAKVTVNIGAPLMADSADRETLHCVVAKLMSDKSE